MEPFAGHDVHSLMINTMMDMGSPMIRLGAYVQGYCEDHGFFLGGNCRKIPEIIDQGLKSGFYREHQGWESVSKLFESDDPIVMSHSSSDGFPNADMLLNIEEEQYCAKVDALEALPAGELFDHCLEKLQTFQAPFFAIKTSGINGFQLRKLLVEKGSKA